MPQLIRAETSVSLVVSNITGPMRFRLTISVIFSLAMLLAPSIRAGEVPWPATIGKWTAASPAGSGTSFPSDPAFAAIVKESGLVAASSRNYKSASQTVQLTVYTFHDSSGAYEAYSAMKAADGAPRAASTWIARGNQVLWIYGSSSLSPDVVRAAETWERSISDGVASPPIATYLPQDNKDLLSERYALGPVAFRDAIKSLGRGDAAGLVDAAGFNSGAEAMFAKFKAGKDDATLLLIEYPTPQLAELHLRHLQRALQDAKLSTSSIERKGSLLSIVLAPSSTKYAEKLRDAINYETEVTWNEPSTTATDPPITSTLVKIIVATGVFMMFTIVFGIAFGGVRVITKRLFPGKVFDRPAQMEVLQLGLSGKPIDSRDMY